MPINFSAWAALLLGLASSACDVNIHEGKASVQVFSTEATQEWAREYPLSADGHVEIANLNGPIELTAAAAGVIEVHASISAKALTESGAKEVLSKGRIDETISPNRVKVETVVPRGIRGAYQVSYQVRVPP